MRCDNGSELFPVVDPSGVVVGSATRGECHGGSMLLHPVVHLHLFNSRGELYLQKRPEWKDIQPGRWDTAVGGHVDYGETPDEAEVVTVDPECAEKLEHARSRILNLIKEKRPRFVPAFELMTFRDNTISVSVPTTELREEILRSKTGMLMRIAELAGIEGMIELEVIVNEEIRAVRPIKLEDRVRYITEKNPLVAELRKALDLEVE